MSGSQIVLMSSPVRAFREVSFFRFWYFTRFSFQISLKWKENRVQYQNLKKETYLNALTYEDIKTIWLPLIVYDNTDQMEVTRLGMDWEWVTSVIVTREGNFTRSSDKEVDEVELFKGAENRLTMHQTYTKEFQCEYVLQRYPFDKQVTDSL